MKSRLLLLIIFLMSCFTLLAAEVPKTIIKIVVKNQFDKPVENAEVILDFIGPRQTRARRQRSIAGE
jgi:hypothetical protein